MLNTRITFPVGPLQCNCTIISNLETRDAIVIDPGGDANKILGYLAEHALKLIKIIHTHAHFDHFMAAGELKSVTGAPIILHKADLFLWNLLEEQCRLFGVQYQPAPPPDGWLEDEADLGWDGRVIHTPGHTPGSSSFWFADQKLLVAGDTLFRHSIGRTDLWGGDFKQIKQSIIQRLFKLDEQAVVVTGHGPETTILDELRFNPILRM